MVSEMLLRTLWETIAVHLDGLEHPWDLIGTQAACQAGRLGGPGLRQYGPEVVTGRFLAVLNNLEDNMKATKQTKKVDYRR